MSLGVFHILLVTSTVIDAVVAGLVLFRRRRPAKGDTSLPTALSITTGRIVLTVAVTTVVFVLKAAALGLAGFNHFGLMHLIYLDLVIVIPLGGLAVILGALVRRGGVVWRPVTKPALVIATAATALAPIGVYATYIERFRLQLEVVGVPVPAERDGCDPIKIGVLSDVQTDHVGEYEHEAVDRLMALEPDVILMPGDLFEGPDWMLERELPALRSLLARLHAPAGVYFVQGNCETRIEAATLLEGTGVQLLNNERRMVQVGDRWLTVGGVELHYTAASRELVQDMERDPDSGDIRILLAHYPGKVTQLSKESRIDLVVAGHTHGGQVQLPFFGPPITETWLPRHVAAGGLHELDGRRVYISRGVGCERGQAPRIRFLCPPEITLLTITDGQSLAEPRN